MVIALFKDIPDVKGDQEAGEREGTSWVDFGAGGGGGGWDKVVKRGVGQGGQGGGWARVVKFGGGGTSWLKCGGGGGQGGRSGFGDRGSALGRGREDEAWVRGNQRGVAGCEYFNGCFSAVERRLESRRSGGCVRKMALCSGRQGDSRWGANWEDLRRASIGNFAGGSSFWRPRMGVGGKGRYIYRCLASGLGRRAVRVWEEESLCTLLRLFEYIRWKKTPIRKRVEGGRGGLKANRGR